MSDALQNLVQAIDDWRTDRKDEVKAKAERAKNPYGGKILQLHKEWGAKRRAALAAIEADRQQYLRDVERYTQLSRDWVAEHPTLPGAPGRPPAPVPDSIKILAAQALRDGRAKTAIRGVLGVANTRKLNEILAEGEALLKAQEAQQ
jgi:hypothetical protein